MIHPFPRRGFKFWATFQVVLWSGATLLLSFLLFSRVYAKMGDMARGKWEVGFLFVVVLVVSIALAELWSVYRKEEYLLEEEFYMFRRRHPKGCRIASLWAFCLLGMGIVTFFGYLSSGPEGYSSVVLASVAGFDVSVICLAARRTRHYLRVDWSTVHIYGW